MRLLIAASIILAGALTGGWLWLRDSSFVAVEHVTVDGASGPDAGRIAGALTVAARRMTTLNADAGRLRKAVAGYPVVAGLRVTTHFPHGIQIRIIERVPVAMVTVNGRAAAVSADGILLPGIGTAEALPALALAAAPHGSPLTASDRPRGSRLSAPDGRQEVALLAAAPYPLISRLAQVRIDAVHGLTARVRAGPILYFGGADELVAKWVAASEVLADSGSAGAAYIDVTDPHRPAAGVGNDESGSASSLASAAPGSTAGTASTQAGPASAGSG